jgi:PilZ domain
LKVGSISFNRAAGIDCRLRNLSPAGACLDVASQVGIPDDFVLVVSYDKFNLVVSYDKFNAPCRIIWRSDSRIGVQFRMARLP